MSVKNKSILFVVAKAFSSKVVAGGGVLALNLLLAHYYGLAGVGQFMLGLSFLLGMGLISRLGMDNALIRDLSVCYENNEDSRFCEIVLSCLLWSFFSSLLMVLTVVLFEACGAGFDMSVPMLLALPLYSSIYLQSSMLKSVGRSAIAPLFETGGVALLLSMLILMLQAVGLRDDEYVEWGFLFSSGIIFLLGAVALVQKYVADGRGFKFDVRKVFVFPWSKFNGLNSFLVLSVNAYFAQWGVILLLGYIVSESDLGAYALAHRLALVISFILIVANGVSSPRFAYYHSVGEKALLQSLVYQVFWVGLFTATSIYMGFIFFAENIISYLVDDAVDVVYLMLVLGGLR